MSCKAITIYTPSGSEPHIAAEDDAFIYDSIFACTSGRLGNLGCTRINDNTVRLSEGGAANRGYILRVPAGSTHDLTISSGAQGVSRHDLIVARFTRGGSDTPDTHEFAVVEGAAAVAPSDPQLTESQLLVYGDVNEVPLFRVVISELAITSIEPLGRDLGNSGLSLAAERLSTPRAIGLTGDLSGSASFDGSADTTIKATVNGICGRTVTVSAGEPENPAVGDLWISFGG